MPDGPNLPDQPFIVQDIFPSNEVHLIFGPSGAGKTTLALQILEDWAAGQEVFGKRAYPLPFVYVACNRTQASLRGHMRELGMNPSAFPHLSLIDHTGREDRTIEAALGLARKQVPEVRVLFLDGMVTLCPGRVNDYKDVDNFLISVLQLCRRERITVMGCLTAVKSKEGQGYVAPRERLHGSGAWSAASMTKLCIDFDKPHKTTDAMRVVILLPQRRPGRLLYYAFEDSGRLVPRTEVSLNSPLEAWLVAQKPGATFTTQELRIVAEQVGVSRTTLFEWLTAQLELGTIIKAQYGVYRIPDPAPIQ